jgi:DNA-binding LacI/PurR family transcriptional regulator
VKRIETDRVLLTMKKGAYDAVNHLIKTGCRNIIHLAGPANLK